MSEDNDLVYELPDPGLSRYDHGLGTLHVNGELEGHLASVVSEMAFPSRQPWLFFVIVWADGSKEPSFEDYGPGWYTVRELDAGFLDHFGPSVTETRRFLWLSLSTSTPGPPRVYDFAWLPAEQSAEKWAKLRLVDTDF